VLPEGAAAPATVTVEVVDVEGGGGYGNGEPWKGGSVTFENVPPKARRLVVAVEGFAPVVRDVTLDPGEERDLGDVLLDPGAEVSGRVTDPAGRPIAGARVQAEMPGFMEEAVATADAEGRFRLSHLPVGEERLTAAAEGFLDLEETVTVAAGVNAHDFSLVVAATLRGRVRDAEGKAAPQVKVVYRMETSLPVGRQAPGEVWTDEDGRFEERVAPGRWTVEARDAEDRVLASRTVAVEARGTADADLVLPAK
jgi:hypothetical protein